MKKTSLILLYSSLDLLAVETQTIHSSTSIYYESKTFSNSVQKNDGVVYGVGADVHVANSQMRLAYEKGKTNTKQPPLNQDLDTDKIFLRYGYSFNKQLTLNANYINILHDNMAPTSHGVTYGAGISLNPTKKISTNFTQYYSAYKDFNALQSDITIEYKSNVEDIKYKLTAIGKYITFQGKNSNTFSKDAKNLYSTLGLKLHAHYQSYHFGVGAFFGKRAFAIMDDGFKIQHHAMEFDRTCAVGVGKTLGDFIVRYQYVYQRAVELQMQNKNVEVVNNRMTLNYKF